MNYRIGLYLDNDKIGWAAIRENEEGHAEHLERIGVRFFPIAESSFNGSTPGAERRMYRLARRRYTRQKYRFAKLRELFSETGLPPMNALGPQACGLFVAVAHRRLGSSIVCRGIGSCTIPYCSPSRFPTWNR